MLTAIRVLLQPAGYAVTCHESAELFLHSLKDGRPDCIILDIDMPGMKGPQMHEWLLKCAIDVPVIYLTGTRDGALRDRAAACNPVAILEKPVARVEIMLAIERALNKPRNTRPD